MSASTLWFVGLLIGSPALALYLLSLARRHDTSADRLGFTVGTTDEDETELSA